MAPPVSHAPARVSLHADSSLGLEIKHGQAAFLTYYGDEPLKPQHKEGYGNSTKATFAWSESDSSHKVDWDGPNDPENPQNWSKSYKWLVTGVCSLLTVNVTFASSAPTSATVAIMQQFGSSEEVTFLITTVFLIGYVFGPLMWAPGSEIVGRRPVFLLTMILYCLFHLGQALAPNIQTLLVTRFLSGVFASAPLTNSGGVLADMWDVVGRGQATSVFTASVFIGPVIGPIVGGFVTDSTLGWRWIFWLTMIFSGACWVVAIFLLPETYAPVLLQKKARRLLKEDPIVNKGIYAEHDRQDWALKAMLKRTLFRPFDMLFNELILVFITIYLSIAYGLLYALFEAFPIIFIEKRGFTRGQNGLVFISVGLGAAIGGALNAYFISHYKELVVKWRGSPPPEQRLFGAMFAAPCFVLGVFWMGWTGQYPSIPWYVPALSAVMVGASISLVFISCQSYLVDTYLASALAANTIVRSAVAASFPLFTVQMFTKLGVNYASTLIGCMGILLAPSPFLFFKYGARIRSSSKFAPCIDLQIKKELEDEQRAAAAKA